MFAILFSICCNSVETWQHTAASETITYSPWFRSVDEREAGRSAINIRGRERRRASKAEAPSTGSQAASASADLPQFLPHTDRQMQTVLSRHNHHKYQFSTIINSFLHTFKLTQIEQPDNFGNDFIFDHCNDWCQPFPKINPKLIQCNMQYKINLRSKTDQTKCRFNLAHKLKQLNCQMIKSINFNFVPKFSPKFEGFAPHFSSFDEHF